MEYGKQKIDFWEENLICPKNKTKLEYLSGTLKNSEGKYYKIYKGIPVFIPFGLNPHQEAEVWGKEAFIKNILDDKNEYYSKDFPYNQSQSCYSWCEKFINNGTVNNDTKIICIGGSFVDDLPHVKSDYKFNVDHLSHKYIDILPSITKANTNYLAAKAEELPFINEYADYVYSRNSLDHLTNPIKAVQEIHRVLKTGSKFVVGVYYNSDFNHDHESSVIDEEFINKIIHPLFDISYKSISDYKTQDNALGADPGFIYFVGEKKNGSINFSLEDIDIHEQILTQFHNGVYFEKRNQLLEALTSWQKIIKLRPILQADAIRIFSSCLKLLCIYAPDLFDKISDKVLLYMKNKNYWFNHLLDIKSRYKILGANYVGTDEINKISQKIQECLFLIA